MRGTQLTLLEWEELLENSKTLTFSYKNWKGRVADRTVLPLKIYWGVCEYHGDAPLMLLYAYEDGVGYRDFAIRDIEFDFDLKSV